jgi:hypothetical protein
VWPTEGRGVIVAAVTYPSAYVPEKEDAFLALFPHRYDYLYAPHPEPGDRPPWQTESRYPLSDRLIHQGAYLYGVRFGAKTQYCLLDIDQGSAYHPHGDPLALQRIYGALEPLGIVSGILCTSSYSGGLHLYFPFEEAQASWQIGAVVTALLENRGFRCRPGQLEVFPNPRLYSGEDSPTLFNGHRLPLQLGSYLLNDDLEPIASQPHHFAQQWRICQQRNLVQRRQIERLLKQQQRSRHRLSQRADKFLNDLNAEIEMGWTGSGQTNYLLGRITLRTYIFHHVLHGGGPLAGVALADEIVAIATQLPGYRQWCRHQEEITTRAAEWARCVENSHYFPYGTGQGKYKPSKSKPKGTHTANVANVANGESSPSAESTTEPNIEQNWNQQRAWAAQQKIQNQVAQLWRAHQWPSTATARFKILVSYGIGGSTLYKYKHLWHPSLWKTPQPPPTFCEGVEDATASPASSTTPTSLLSATARNPLPDQEYSDLDIAPAPPADRNFAPDCSPEIGGPLRWPRLLRQIKAAQQQQRATLSAQKQTQWQDKAVRDRQRHQQRMGAYLRSRDPILMGEGLQWLLQQDTPGWRDLLPGEMAGVQGPYCHSSDNSSDNSSGLSRFPDSPQLAPVMAVCALLRQAAHPPPVLYAQWRQQGGSLPASTQDWGRFSQWLQRYPGRERTVP